MGSILSASSWAIFGWVITGWWYYWMHTHARVVSCSCRIGHRVENEVGEQAKEAKLTSLGHTLSTTNSVPTETVHSQGNTPRPSCLNGLPSQCTSFLTKLPAYWPWERRQPIKHSSFESIINHKMTLCCSHVSPENCKCLFVLVFDF